MSLERWNRSLSRNNGLYKQANFFTNLYQKATPFFRNYGQNFKGHVYSDALNAAQKTQATLNKSLATGNVGNLQSMLMTGADLAATNPTAAGLAILGSLTPSAIGAFKKTMSQLGGSKGRSTARTIDDVQGFKKQTDNLLNKTRDAQSFIENNPGFIENISNTVGSVFSKIGSEGHWRKLPADHKGKDQNGNPIQGKTWVSKSRIKSWFKPYDHQAQFLKRVKKLPDAGGGLIAAHGTGTGKTITAVAAFEDMKERGKAKRALVITPAGLRNNFLEKGVEKFTDSKGQIVSNAKKDIGDETEYIITSYEAFRANPDSFIEKYKPDVLIADEFHRAGNPSSTTHQAIMSAREKVPYFLGLTASISQNDPSDVAPLLRLSSGGKSPISDKTTFKKKHVKKVVSKNRGMFGGKTYEKKLVNTERLKKVLGADIHYLEDLDADKKPIKEVETVPVEMSKEQLSVYKDAMKGIDPVIQAKIAKGEAVEQKEAMRVFTRLMRARQVSNSLHNVIPDMTLSEAAEKTPKIKKILDDAEAHIKDKSDAQIVIYTNIVKGGVDIISEGLNNRGIEYGVFAGKSMPGISEKKRQQDVRDYLEGKKKVIIITGAGAEGLSLGNTTMVMLADGHYNPERISQAEARGVRAGGLSHRPKEERKVRVKRYVSALPKTFFQKILFQDRTKGVDEWVYATAAKKDRVNKQLRAVLKEKSQEVDQPTFVERLFGG